MSETETVFAEELTELYLAIQAVGNAEWTPDLQDPRNFDPDDAPLAQMMLAANRVEEAALKLQEAVRREVREREATLDAMPEEVYDAWCKIIDGLPE